ncbi:hypothetical protein GCM10009430_36600 [Aquimarina litoralis]|uniref:Peptidoglycan binding domain-containing protein n=1 Tax=Aquimarina litoralis TaxID=584605 RepID=A0ABN1J4E8_9FLAO
MRLQRKKKPGVQHQGSQAFIQPKLKVGQPGDKYEVEADKMADQVVNKPSSKTEGAIQKKGSEEEVQQKPLASTITPFVQRSMFKDRNEGTVQKMEEEEAVQQKEEEESVQKMEEEETVQQKEEEDAVQKMEEEETVQSKCDDCESEESVQKMEEEEPVQAKSNTNLVSSNSDKDSSIESRLKNSKGKGNKMTGDTKNEMETGFGADFSNVNIHTDTNAVQLSQELGAQAFTHGNDVYFNKGKYNPDSKEGKHLLAHELTHTVQQSGMIQRSVSEKESKDLQAERFKGNFRLEQAHDHIKFISKGSKGSHVEKLQKGLMNIGFALPQFGADGDFGNETERAVFSFQNAYNLSVDGIVGSETMGTLDDVHSGKSLGTGCCVEAFQLPQSGLPFKTINGEMLSEKTFCTKKSFRITSFANWVKPHVSKHYRLSIVAIDHGSVHKPIRRFDIGKSETQFFKIKTKDCMFFKVFIQVFDPSSSPELRGHITLV